MANTTHKATSMNTYKVTYRKRNHSRSVVGVETIEAACLNDAMWKAFGYARIFGFDAEVTEA